MEKKICILGSTGLVGSNLYKKYLEKYPDANILAPKRYSLNLNDWKDTLDYLLSNKPVYNVGVFGGGSQLIYRLATERSTNKGGI